MSQILRLTDTLSSLDGYSSLDHSELAISQLYSLQPIGVGTGLVESLTSYMARLARAHRVTPAQLFTKQILPLMNEFPPESRIGRCTSIFGGYNRFFNGATKPAAFVTAALQRLTLRTDLVSLSMLRWRNVISSIAISKQTRAWCAQCFTDWQTTGKVIAEPLIWTINLVTVCAVHKLPLCTECPVCRETSAPLEGRLKVGYCAKCGAWLGRPSSEAAAESYIHSSGLQPKFVSQQLFEALKVSDVAPHHAALDTRIEILLRNRGWSSVSSFTRTVGMEKYQFFDIKYKRNRMSLKTLLRICQAAEIDLKELLCPQATMQRVHPSTVRYTARRFGNWKDLIFIEAIRTALESAVAEAYPTSLSKIALTFRCTRDELRQNFPQLCKQIDVKQRRFRRRRRRRLAVRLEQALKEDEPPSIKALGKQLHVSSSSLYIDFPQQVAQLSARYRTFKAQSFVVKKTAAAEMIRQAAATLHVRGEYPSIRRVLRELGWKRSREDDAFVRRILSEIRSELGIVEIASIR